MNVTFEKLQKSYDGRKVLDIEKGIIKSGSRTAIIGPNGAGKSTLLKILSGLEQADAGIISYDGSSEFPQMDATMVFQKPYLISTTVEKNIAYPMKLRGFSDDEIEKRVTELTEELGLASFRKQKAWKLSGGETQKVALARALSFKPSLLLLDEPTANVDPYTTAEIEKMLVTASEYATIVLITHNLAQAKRVCDEAMMMHEGKVIEFGPCEEVLLRPSSIETRRFVEGELIL